MENSSLPPQIKDWIGKTVVKDSSPFIVQSVLWQNFCSAIEDGNSLYWDAEVAKNHTNQIVAHPALLPSWLHDFEWHPHCFEQHVSLCYSTDHVFHSVEK